MGDEEGANELGGIDGYRVGSDEGSSDVDGMRLGSTEGISDFDGPEDIDGTGLGLAERAGLGRAEGADVMLGKAEGLSDIVGAVEGKADDMAAKRSYECGTFEIGKNEFNRRSCSCVVH